MPRAGQALRAPEVAPSTWGWEASDPRPVLTSKARQGAVTRVQGSDPHIPSSVHWSIRRTTQKQGRKWTVPPTCDLHSRKLELPGPLLRRMVQAPSPAPIHPAARRLRPNSPATLAGLSFGLAQSLKPHKASVHHLHVSTLGELSFRWGLCDLHRTTWEKPKAQKCADTEAAEIGRAHV